MVFSGILLNTNKNNILSSPQEQPELFDTTKTWSLQHNDSNFASSGNRKGFELVISKDGKRLAYHSSFEGQGTNRYYKYTGTTLNDSGSWQLVSWNSNSYLSAQITSARGNESDRLGGIMAMSYDGNTVALVAPVFNQFRGKVEIWKTNNNTNPTNLIPKGSGTNYIIENTNVLSNWTNNQTIGTHLRAVALSGDGNILVVSELYFEVSEKRVGRFSVYEYDSANDNWVFKTSVNNHGTNEFKQFGREITCSEDANVIVVGEPNNNKAHIYRRVGINWNWNHETEIINGLSGHKVATSNNGNVVGVCCVTANGNTGSVEVWKYNISTSLWELLGNKINGNVNGYPSGSVNYFGKALGFSSDGYKLVTGSEHYHVNGVQYVGGMKMYQYNPTTNVWDDLGNPNIIIGTNPKETSPNTLRMTGDGKHFAVAAFEYNAGTINFYKYDL
jgi:hypothetical protein